MKILFVEDELELSNPLTHLLKDNNYDVTPVYDGEAALESCSKNIFDLIILDIMLPKKSGIEVLSTLREKDIFTPVILLTALTDEATKIKGLDRGADDYITKPFSTNELLARIRAILRRNNKENTSDILSFGDLTLNLLNYEIYTDKKSIKVSAKEFAILKLFLENQGRVLSRNDIVSSIWNTDEELESNSLEVYLSFIRRKLLFVGTSVNIAAVRGVGYRIEK